MRRLDHASAGCESPRTDDVRTACGGVDWSCDGHHRPEPNACRYRRGDPGRAGRARQSGPRRGPALAATATGSRPPTAGPARAARGSRTPTGSPSWCRCATAGCSSRRSPSTAAPRRSWPPTWRRHADLGALGAGCAATRTSRTSAPSRPPDRDLVFDINDFDETLPGPWEWDLKRLVASFEIAGRDRGFGDAQRREIVLAAARAYRETMRGSRRCSNLDVWYARLDVDADPRGVRAGGQQEASARPFERRRRQGPRKDRLRALRRSSPHGSTASCGSSTTRRCSCRSRILSRASSCETAQTRLAEVLEALPARR